MGIVGYTYDEVGAMPMHAIKAAISARYKLVNTILEAFLGKSEADAIPDGVSTRPMSVSLFDALFAGSR